MIIVGMWSCTVYERCIHNTNLSGRDGVSIDINVSHDPVIPAQSIGTQRKFALERRD
jgi:hypothetical protein